MLAASVHGIVVAGAYPVGSVLDSLVPRPLLPVAQQPLVSYALRWMQGGGVRGVTICANSAARAIRQRLGDAAYGLGLDYLEDWNPRGAAGCVRDAGERTSALSFVVADGSSLPDVELGELLRVHNSNEAVLTVVVAADATGRLCPTGVYVFDRRAFATIPADGYQDIKERLIPQLYKSGQTVATHIARTVAPRVVNTDTYLALDAWAIERALLGQPLDGDYRVNGNAVVHAGAQVDPSARLLGPVLLGPGSSVAAEATLVGPVSLGDGVSVGRRAVVSRSVLWSGCSIGEDALVDRCMLAEQVRVAPGRTLFATLGTDERVAVVGDPRGRAAWPPLTPPLRPISLDHL